MLLILVGARIGLPAFCQHQQPQWVTAKIAVTSIFPPGRVLNLPLS
jgi:hypothetical protein